MNKNMDYKSVLEEHIRELQKAQNKTMSEKTIHVHFINEITKNILEIIQELRTHNY